MKLSKWAKRLEEKGESPVRYLHFEARLAYNTVKAALRGEPISYQSAKKIVDATGGEVDLISLCEGEGG
jgi:hypothetical protein